MSYKAKRLDQRLAAAASAAADELDISSPQKIFAQLGEEKNLERKVLRDLGGFRDTWNRAGCELLMEGAQNYYEEKTGKELPYNLAIHGPWVGENFWKNHLITEENPGLVPYAAHAAWWLKTVADECPGLVMLFERTTSTRGMNSPSTTTTPYQILERFRSPGAAEKKFWAVRERANGILKPYGLRVCWRELGNALAHYRATGKSAFRAAAATVNAYAFGMDIYGDQKLNGRSVEVLVKGRGVKAAKEMLSEEEMCWAAWRVNEGEFPSIRVAARYAWRLQRNEVGILVDPTLARDYKGCISDCRMKEVRADTFGSSAVFSFRGHKQTYAVWGEEDVQSGFWRVISEYYLQEQHPTYTPFRYNLKDLHGLSEYLLGAVKVALNNVHNQGSPRTLERWRYKGYHSPEYQNLSSQKQAWALDRLQAGEFKTLAKAVEESGRLIVDKTDDVSLLVDPTLDKLVHGVLVRQGWGGTQYSDRIQILIQKGTGRTFHTNPVRSHRIVGLKELVRGAITAWRKQAALQQQEANLVGFLEGAEGWCPIVRLQDATVSRTGNCQAGTLSWMERAGISDRAWIPAEWLVKYLDQWRVKNVAVALYRDFH